MVFKFVVDSFLARFVLFLRCCCVSFFRRERDFDRKIFAFKDVTKLSVFFFVGFVFAWFSLLELQFLVSIWLKWLFSIRNFFCSHCFVCHNSAQSLDLVSCSPPQKQNEPEIKTNKRTNYWIQVTKLSQMRSIEMHWNLFRLLLFTLIMCAVCLPIVLLLLLSSSRVFSYHLKIVCMQWCDNEHCWLRYAAATQFLIALILLAKSTFVLISLGVQPQRCKQ